ncbi:AfsR/SARP family transcriptional regulator [Rugosimonospora africana]|uniref:SARP family transcriptional regulator n=1 Tax=Rugosimonospora africana TaxID=556532 RepID=A0A8J3QRI8_9ACTN|nr:BTAD domain-containing putative transcriptional regulator [Rugosimonospora africana]GIH15211.1 SARP family transcriptional regulator [Rugosimonospora africana]
MEFRLLGEFQATHDGRRVDLGRRRERCLLAILLLEAGAVLPADRLVDLLWDGQPPDAARASLHTHLSRLRALLDADGTGRLGVRLFTYHGGYGVDVDRESVDALRFQSLVGQADAEADPALRVGLLRTAIGLWSGPLLADTASESLRRRVGGKLGELRLAATERMVDAELACGRHASLIGELTALCAEYPHRERLHGQLMLALYRCGRHADAVAAYAAYRTRLADDLGLDPSQELRGLHIAMLRQVPRLASRDTAAPVLVPVPAQLPAPASHFTGRRDALKALDQLLPDLDDPAPVVLVSAVAGTAGVGKTSLAVHWAHLVAERFPDGQLYVDLRGYDEANEMEPAAALEGFLRALGLEPAAIPQALHERSALFRSSLAGRRALVLLDNARSADQVRPLLPGSAGCMALVTSRDDLTGLAVREGAHRMVLDCLPEPEGVDLLRAILGPERIAAEPEAAAELTRICAGLPLALRVIAERAAGLPDARLAELVTELGADPTRRLDALDVPGDPGLGVRAVFAGSYRALNGDSAQLFRHLGQHPGAQVATATAASLTGTEPAAIRGVLHRLASAHLVERVAADRYQTHDLLRAYAVEQSHEHDSVETRREAVARLLDHYLHSADAASRRLNPHRRRTPLPEAAPGVRPLEFAEHRDAQQWCETERANLVASVRLAAEHEWDEHAWLLAERMLDFLDLTKSWDDWLATHRLALRAARHAGNRTAEASTLNSLGVAYLQLRRFEEAIEYHGQALVACRDTGQRYLECLVLGNLGIAYREVNRLADAIDCHQRVLIAFQEMGNRNGEGRVLNSLGLSYLSMGRFAEAEEHCERALAIHREVRDRRNEGTSLNNLGEARRNLGHTAEAIADLRAALAILREVGDQGEAAETLDRLGRALHDAGQPRAAQECWREALAIFTAIGDPRAEEVRRAAEGELR